MLNHCVNPSCRVAFSHIREGRTFSIEGVLTAKPRGAKGHGEYWLCGTCSRSYKIVIENGRVITVPLEIETASLAG